MSTTFQLMSGEIHSVEIFDGYRIRNLRHEVYTILRKEDPSLESERIFFSDNVDDYDSIDDYDYVSDGDHYYVFIKDKDPIPRLRLTLEDNILCLRNEEGQLVRYCGWEPVNINEPQVEEPEEAVLEVDIPEEAYDVMRGDIRSAVADEDGDDSDLDELDDNARVFDIFYERFVRLFLLSELVML